MPTAWSAWGAVKPPLLSRTVRATEKYAVPSGIWEIWTRTMPGVRKAWCSFQRGHAPEKRAKRKPDAEKRLEMFPAICNEINECGEEMPVLKLIGGFCPTLFDAVNPLLTLGCDELTGVLEDQLGGGLGGGAVTVSPGDLVADARRPRLCVGLPLPSTFALVLLLRPPRPRA